MGIPTPTGLWALDGLWGRTYRWNEPEGTRQMAIAAFFGRDIRTVQRWEGDEGLPVHRHRHSSDSRKSSVYAYPEELRQWWESSSMADVSPAAAAALPEPARGRTASRWTRGAVLAAGGLALVVAAAAGLRWPARDQARASFPIQRIAEDAAIVNVRSLRDLIETRHDGVRIYFGDARTSEGRAPSVRIATAPDRDLAAAAVGDVDGDGLGDLVLGDQFREPETYTGTGVTFLVRGRREWPSNMILPRDADAAFTMGASNDVRLTACVDSRSIDLNEDGLADIVLGGSEFVAPGRSGAGGDFTGDGRTDLAVTASERTLWNMLGGRGRVYIVSGQDRWPRHLEIDRATVRIDGTRHDAEVIRPALADIDGGGADDLLFGYVSAAAGRSERRVAVFFGGAQSVRKTLGEADVVFGMPNTPNSFGDAVASMDANGDGRDDVIVADSMTGSIWLLLGRADWAPRAPWAAHQPIPLVAAEPGAGMQGIAVGDFDGDGLANVAYAINPIRLGRPAPVRTALLTPYLPLAVDIRPAPGKPNVALRPGVLAVGVAAIPGTAFADLDQASLRLAGQSATHVSWNDFNGDSVPDLQLYFDTTALPDAVTRLALVGRTKSGWPVAGSDDVTVVPIQRTSGR